MRFKGFNIVPHYSVCADWKIAESTGGVVPKSKSSEDIEYYEILDPINNDNRWIAEFTISECKETINQWLMSVNMKDNSPKSWERLEKVKS